MSKTAHKKFIKNQRRVAVLFGLLVSFAITCMILVSLIGKNNREITSLQDEQSALLALGDELRQSSDDLTKMARLYVFSQDTIYKKYYDEIVKIREGESERPLTYGDVYWDLVLASGNEPRTRERSINFIDLLKEKKASEDQIEFIERAKFNSDRLVKIEIEAFSALDGIFKDAEGYYSKRLPPNPNFARELLSSNEYNRAKADIMQPIQSFLEMVRTDYSLKIHSREKQNKVFFMMLFLIIGFACIIMGIAAFQLFNLTRNSGDELLEIEKLKPGLWNEIKNNWTLILAAGIVSFGIVLFNLYAATQIKDKTEEGLTESLKTVHLTTKKSLVSWLEGIENEITEMTEYVDFRSQMNEVFSRPIQLLELDVKIGLDYLVTSFIHDRSFYGYILTDANQNLFMSRMPDGKMDVNFSTDNIEDFESLLDGNKMISFEMPIRNNDSTDEFNRFLKIGVPLIKRDSVFGVVFFLYLPDKSFTDFLQNGRIGNSGETFAFNSRGQMISESRFDEILKEQKLLLRDQNAILNISLKVPKYDGEREKGSYTLMAESALKGISDINISGYTDYRGMKVAGIWSWDEKFGFGMATEFDLEEALGPQKYYKKVLASGSVFSIFLLLVLTVLSIRSRIIASEQSRELEAAFEQVNEGKQELEQINFLSDAALDLTRAGYWHVPLDGSGYYKSSAKAAKLNGDPPREDFRYKLKEEWFENLFAADEKMANAAMKNFNEALSGKRPFYDAIYAYKRPIDGNVVYMRAIGKVRRGKGGKAQDMYGVIQDITENVKAQDKIKENEDRLILSQNIGHIGSWDWNIEKDTMIWSQEMYTIFGVNKKSFRPSIQKHQGFIHEDDLKHVQKAIDEALESNETLEIEHRIVLASGSTRYIKQTGKRFKNSKDEVVRFIGTCIDITEGRLMQNELEMAFKTIKVQNERMSGELNVAKDIQMSMLPLIFPAFPRRADIDIHAQLIPAREVGGDFYDFFFVDEKHLCFVVGDVSGKGVPAALMMAVCKTVIKSRSSNDLSPASILTHVNNEMAKENNNYMFVTVFLAILDTKSGKLIYCNAGHNPSYVLRKNDVEKLTDLHGPVIAAMEGMAYSETNVQLEEGDFVFAYTDGIPEAHNPEGDLYGDQKLQQKLASIQKHSSQKFVDDIIESVIVFEKDSERFDDITALCVRFVGSNMSNKHESFGLTLSNTEDQITVLNKRFEDFSNRNGLREEALDKMNIVFDELLANIIKYAFDDVEERTIQVKVDLHSDKLIVEIEDDGLPFNPFTREMPDLKLSVTDREIGGLGIHLVRNLMDEYSYKRLVGKNVVTLVKFDVIGDSA